MSYANLEKLGRNAYYTGYCEGAVYRVHLHAHAWVAICLTPCTIHSTLRARTLGEISTKLEARGAAIRKGRAIVKAFDQKAA